MSVPLNEYPESLCLGAGFLGFAAACPIVMRASSDLPATLMVVERPAIKVGADGNRRATGSTAGRAHGGHTSAIRTPRSGVHYPANGLLPGFQ